jgi:ATP-dependent Lhr-like helicase
MTDRWRHWLSDRGWAPFPFQEEAWRSYLDGESGLIHAPTGTGKTLAVWGGPVLEGLERLEREGPPRDVEPLRVLWITPLRALASDTVENLRQPVEALRLPWSVELRTGDTSSARRRRQRERLPTALVTTPESLALLLSYAESARRFRSLRCIVVDEWHELLGSKRGVQAELGLTRLRAIAPDVRTWGLSATLGNTEQAVEVVLGPAAAAGGRLLRGEIEKSIRVETLRPAHVDRFPWAGHIGLTLLPKVIDAIESAASTLVFTNTRSQTEAWFKALIDRRPDWIGAIALHHGSLDRAVRAEVEDLLRAGRLRCVVCTSSLDLGVDFTPVDQVIQVGSPKGVARMLQRAGRSGHQPGAVSRILGVPTNALELMEFSAARGAVASRRVERREAVRRPLDVLVSTTTRGDGRWTS